MERGGTDMDQARAGYFGTRDTSPSHGRHDARTTSPQRGRRGSQMNRPVDGAGKKKRDNGRDCAVNGGPFPGYVHVGRNVVRARTQALYGQGQPMVRDPFLVA